MESSEHSVSSVSMNCSYGGGGDEHDYMDSNETAS